MKDEGLEYLIKPKLDDLILILMVVCVKNEGEFFLPSELVNKNRSGKLSIMKTRNDDIIIRFLEDES